MRTCRIVTEPASTDLSRWASTVAHAVRNPLAGIRGAVQIIGKRLPEAAAEREIAEEICQRIDVLDRLLDEMLRYARPTPLALDEVELRGVIDDAVDRARHRGQAPATVTVEGAAVALRIDAAEVGAAIGRLVDNARQAGASRVDVIVVSNGAGAAVHLDDDGPGIAPEDRAAAMEPFASTRPGGTGLGLPLVARVVQAHGGSVELGDAPGTSGLRVTLRFPSHPPGK